MYSHSSVHSLFKNILSLLRCFILQTWKPRLRDLSDFSRSHSYQGAEVGLELHLLTWNPILCPLLSCCLPLHVNLSWERDSTNAPRQLTPIYSCIWSPFLEWKQWQNLFSWAPKSLQMVTAAMKLKEACSLEEKLWPTSHIKKQRHYFAYKGPYSQSYGFFSSHVLMWKP